MLNFFVKSWYNYISSHDRSGQVIFLNYGFIGNEKPRLSEAEETNRNYIQLYHHAVNKLKIKNTRVLEIGSGRGGGAFYVSTHFKPEIYFGLDLSERATKFCKNFYKYKNLKFINGDAMRLPFPDEFFDIVINVESSHTYKSFERFIKEVTRVLKPKGKFVFVDHRPRDKTSELISALKKEFSIKKKENITKNIVKALDKDSKNKERLISNESPKLLKNLFLDFAGVKGSSIYNRFKFQDSLYWNFLLKKAN